MKLIAFKDGSYLELYSWVGNPTPGHPWSNRETGILDFALSSGLPSTATSNWTRLTKRLAEDNGDGQLGVKYGALKPGGRTTLDGAKLEWETLHAEYFDAPKSPPAQYIPPGGRIEAPFWCHDRTERRLRTPFDDPKKTTHPCGATGLSQVDIIVPESLLKEYVQLYETVTGGQAEPSQDSALRDTVASGYIITLPSPVSADTSQRIWVHPPLNEKDEESLKKRGVGFAGFNLKIEGQSGHDFKKLSIVDAGSKIGLVW